MVALAGLLEQRQVLVEGRAIRPSRAVDALEHLVAFVTAPVGTRHMRELEGAESPGRGHVRPAAEVDEVALPIERDVVAGRDRADDLGLVLLAHA